MEGCNCLDCGKELSKKIYKRCQSCNQKGNLNRMWKGGLPKCLNCGVICKFSMSKYCMKCYQLGDRNHMFGIKSEDHHGYKGGKPKCIDCGKQFNYYGHKRCMNCNSIFKRGKNSNFYIDGRSELRSLIRSTSKYKNWIKGVFKRDNYTCNECGQYGGALNAHHKIPFIKIYLENNIETLDEAIKVEEFWDINNGITLCVNCHRKIPKIRPKYKEVFL